MAVKTITIKETVYDKLASTKRDNESFSDLFERLVEKEKPNLMQFAGILSDNDAKKMRTEIKKLRKESEKNAKEREKRFGL